MPYSAKIQKMEPNSRKRILLILSLAFVGFLVWSSVTFQGALSHYLPFFENLARSNKVLSIAVFIALGALSTMFSSFSSVPLVPIAVIVWGNWLAALFLVVGWVTGDVLSYWVGYFAGNPILKRLVPFEKIEYYRKKIPPNAEFRLVFFFIMSMPSEIPGYSLGTLRYNFKKYFLITTLGEMIFAPVTAFAGRALVEKNPVVFLGAVLFMVLFFAYSFSVFSRYVRKEK